MSNVYKIFLIVVLSVFSDTNLSATDAPSGLPSKFASTFNKLGGYVNAESRFLLSQGDVFSKVFKYETQAGVVYASELRYLRDFDNVNQVKFAGKLDNIRYTDNGKDLTGLFLVEDLDNSNSFFILTENDFTEGLAKIDNFDDVVADYRAFEGLVEGGSDLLTGIKNTLKSVGITDVKILSKLDNWNTSTLTKFDGIINNPNYAGILNEFKLNADLFDKFKLVEETWWAKYSMAGITKRSGSTTPTQFKKYVGDIEVTVSGTGKLKLKNISLDEASGQYLGKLFDDAITQNVKSSWISGDFSQFPTAIQNHLSNLKSQGYKLVVEPQVTVLGKNPKPDFLLVKKEIIAGVTTYDVKYLEIKYLDDVPYTPSQKAITENVPAQVIKKDLDRMYDVNDIEVVPLNTHITVNEVTKLTVDKTTLEMILQ